MAYDAARFRPRSQDVPRPPSSVYSIGPGPGPAPPPAPGPELQGFGYPPLPSPPLPSHRYNAQRDSAGASGGGRESGGAAGRSGGYGGGGGSGEGGSAWDRATTPELGHDSWYGGPHGYIEPPLSPGSPAFPRDERAPLYQGPAGSAPPSPGMLSGSPGPYGDSPYPRSVDSGSVSSLGFTGSTAKLNHYPSYPTEEKLDLHALASSAKPAPSAGRKKLVWGGVVLLAAAVIGGVGAYVASRSSHRVALSSASGSGAGSGSGSGSGGSATGGGAASKPVNATGGDGSLVTDDKGQTFTYKNPYGGYWVNTPFDDSARAQNYVSPLNQSWDYARDRIHGVNLGGWLTLEPFISPALFEPFENSATPAIDEYTLSTNLGSNLATTLTQHYDTFITEQDFAAIAGAGLNWVRIPLPYWAIETYPGEPFLAGVSWTYFLKAITWARKYGLRINLDYHATPGSQNGWNHSSKYGTVNFLLGTMGIANAQRALNYLRALAEFVSQPQYSNVVVMFSILNEAQLPTIGTTQMRSFHLEAYNMIRAISGFGDRKGPFLAVHDGFVGQPAWAGFLSGADRLGLDTHTYLCFSPQANDNTMTQNIMTPCTTWGPSYNTSFGAFGFSMAGEWSLAVTDCGQYVNGVGQGTREEGTYPTPATTTTTRHGSCDPWVDASTWSAELKAQFRQLQYAHQDGLQNSFFWTWKIGNTSRTNPPRVANPMWSYSYGLEQGYISPDPRGSVGSCAAMAGQFNVPAPSQVNWGGNFRSAQTGGSANPSIAADQLASYGAWPPATINGIATAANLPVYTATGAPKTLSASTPSPSGPTGTVAPGNGWYQPSDTAGWYTPIAGCHNYVDPWSGNGAVAPASNAGCTAAAATRRRAVRAEPTNPAARHRRSAKAARP